MRWRGGAATDGEDGGLATARAWRRGARGVKLRRGVKIVFHFADFSSFQLEGRVAVVANVVVAALGLARVEHVGRAALWAGYSDGSQFHGDSAWLKAKRAVKAQEW